MISPRPYQPALLRLLHAVISVLILASLVTGFWVYNTFDRRWGTLPMPQIDAVIDLHGTIAVTFFFLLPAFALYSLRVGHQRLVNERSMEQLTWRSGHQVANTVMLLSATLAALSGRMMKEAWLPSGELNHLWYIGHLVAWALLIVSLLAHLLLGLKVGGVPLLTSIYHWKVRSSDMPRSWLQNFLKKHRSGMLQTIEVVVLGGILLALILPVFNH
jgi:hypothetical protein